MPDAPKDPQNETIKGRPSRMPSSCRACSFVRVKKPPRTGVPVTTTRLGSRYCSRHASTLTMIRSANRSSKRVVSPGTMLDSWMAVGMPALAAALTMGKLA